MKFRKYILLAAALFISTQSMAAFTLNGTRITDIPHHFQE